MKVALTGATGFVGGVLLEHLLAEGDDVRALARSAGRLSARDRLTIIEGDLNDKDALARLAEGADIFIHLAGVTHPRDDADFARVNVEGAANAASAAFGAGARLVHASSLSAREPTLSPYAHSKALSEAAVADLAGDVAWTALRLPAIYGPGDHATLPYFKLVKAGFALAPRTDPPARASLLYVDDAASALIHAARATPFGEIFEVADDREGGRDWFEIGATLARAMNKNARPVAAPKPVVALFQNISRAASRLRGRAPETRTGQVEELFHIDWVARGGAFFAKTGWRAKTPLEEGFAKTIRWYQDSALL
ncbi:MAG: NAD(P)-dependent oxidoreductase [Pseudomonadota bacterium]